MAASKGHCWDAYVRDLTTGVTTLVSVDATGTAAGSGASSVGPFSPDGTKVLFDSYAADLGPRDTNEWSDIYLRDLADGSIVQVTANADGTDAGNGFTLWSSGFSPDGTRVVFATFADDLGPRDTNRSAAELGGWDVYVRNLGSGTATLVSAIADGTDSGDGDSSAPSFSPDGTRVAFSSTASNLGPRDTNGSPDIYVATLHGADLVARLIASPAPARPGRELTYTVKATNEGPDDAEDTHAALLIPEGTRLIEATGTPGGPGGDCDPPPPEEPRLVVCPVGDMEAGQSTTVEVTVRVTASPGTTLRAIAAYDRSATPDPDRRNDVTVLDTPVTGHAPT